MPHTQSDPHPRSFSEVLADIAERANPKLELGELVSEFEERGFGALLLFLGLLSTVIGWIPGSTTVLGVPIMLIGIQLIIRRDELWLPSRALKAEINRADYAAGVAKALPALRKVERLSRPRMPFMSTDASEMLIGLACVLWAAVLMLPLIGFNLVPSLLVAMFGFGLMQKDGVVMLAGWAGSCAFGATIWLAWEIVSRAIEASWAWMSGVF